MRRADGFVPSCAAQEEDLGKIQGLIPSGESQNHRGWKRSPRSSPALGQTPPCPLSRGPECHNSSFLTNPREFFLEHLLCNPGLILAFSGVVEPSVSDQQGARGWWSSTIPVRFCTRSSRIGTFPMGQSQPSLRHWDKPRGGGGGGGNPSNLPLSSTGEVAQKRFFNSLVLNIKQNTFKTYLYSTDIYHPDRN